MGSEGQLAGVLLCLAPPCLPLPSFLPPPTHPQVIPGTDAYRYNFWGYSTVGYFAPMARFSAAAQEGAAQGASAQAAVLDEFRQLVKECHRRGIEVILDVVFNHTAEGNEQGPTLSFRCGQGCRAGLQGAAAALRWATLSSPPTPACFTYPCHDLATNSPSHLL